MRSDGERAHLGSVMEGCQASEKREVVVRGRWRAAELGKQRSRERKRESEGPEALK